MLRQHFWLYAALVLSVGAVAKGERVPEVLVKFLRGRTQGAFQQHAFPLDEPSSRGKQSNQLIATRHKVRVRRYCCNAGFGFPQNAQAQQYCSAPVIVPRIR